MDILPQTSSAKASNLPGDSAGITIVDILGLWKNENSIVNQKTAYYFASMTFLAWPMIQQWDPQEPRIAQLLASVGLTFSVISFFSISRTAAYRSHWLQKAKKANPDVFATLFGDVRTYWHQRIPSNYLLMGLPIIGCFFWLFIILELSFGFVW